MGKEGKKVENKGSWLAPVSSIFSGFAETAASIASFFSAAAAGVPAAQAQVLGGDGERFDPKDAGVKVEKNGRVGPEKKRASVEDTFGPKEVLVGPKIYPENGGMSVVAAAAAAAAEASAKFAVDLPKLQSSIGDAWDKLCEQCINHNVDMEGLEALPRNKDGTMKITMEEGATALSNEGKKSVVDAFEAYAEAKNTYAVASNSQGVVEYDPAKDNGAERDAILARKKEVVEEKAAEQSAMKPARVAKEKNMEELLGKFRVARSAAFEKYHSAYIPENLAFEDEIPKQKDLQFKNTSDEQEGPLHAMRVLKAEGGIVR